MKIVADENIPFARELFSLLGNVERVAGRTCSASQLQEADALIVRSVTKVNAALLAESNVKFVGTCTIGKDHVDIPYLNENDIYFCSAPGCNADSVVQYVVCALAACRPIFFDIQTQPPRSTRLKAAIIGCGNVGSRVYRALTALGFHCVGVDPHLTHHSDMQIEDLDTIYDADVICMHTPLVKVGEYPTVDLISTKELRQLKSGALLLNAGRGECINESALLKHMAQGAELDVILDVWPNEPNMSSSLFQHVKIGTPHIAGYSFEGKVNGTTMIFAEYAKFLGRSQSWIDQTLTRFKKSYLGEPETLPNGGFNTYLRASYDVLNDHNALERALTGLPESFDLLRKTYPIRREFSHYRILRSSSEHAAGKAELSALGFHF